MCSSSNNLHSAQKVAIIHYFRSFAKLTFNWFTLLIYCTHSCLVIILFFEIQKNGICVKEIHMKFKDKRCWISFIFVIIQHTVTVN